jgi:hypothetical protein
VGSSPTEGFKGPANQRVLLPLEARFEPLFSTEGIGSRDSGRHQNACKCPNEARQLLERSSRGQVLGTGASHAAAFGELFQSLLVWVDWVARSTCRLLHRPMPTEALAAARSGSAYRPRDLDTSSCSRLKL